MVDVFSTQVANQLTMQVGEFNSVDYGNVAVTIRLIERSSRCIDGLPACKDGS